MKYTLALAALLGLTHVEETNAITVWTTRGEIAYEESESDDDETAIQLNDWHPGQSGTLGKAEYKRVVTPRFATDDDDIFMRSMIENYAIEKATEVKDGEKNADGTPKVEEPTGNFVMNEATMRAAASEVLCTHKGLCGGTLQKYLDTYFAKAWGHFDVNRTGEVEVIKSPQFMRFLASDQYMSLQ